MEGQKVTQLEIWTDKLPEDKAKHYNRSRMSLELFARKIGTTPASILEDLQGNGFIYNPNERIFRRYKTHPHNPSGGNSILARLFSDCTQESPPV
jgi:hypothetical protein